MLGIRPLVGTCGLVAGMGFFSMIPVAAVRFPHEATRALPVTPTSFSAVRRSTTANLGRSLGDTIRANRNPVLQIEKPNRDTAPLIGCRIRANHDSKEIVVVVVERSLSLRGPFRVRGRRRITAVR